MGFRFDSIKAWFRTIVADGQVIKRSGNSFVGVDPGELAPAGDFEPATTAAYDLGVTGTRWRRAYLSGGITATAAATFVAGANTLIGAIADKLNAAHLAIASQAIGDLLYADSTTSFSRLAGVATGQVLKSGGVGAAPAWGAIGGATAAGSAHGHTFTGTTPATAAAELTNGTGFATAGQVVTTTGNFTATLDQYANCWLISATQAPCLILSHAAVTGAPLELTVYGAAPATDAGTFKILRAPTPAGTNATEAAHTHSGTGLT